MRSAPEVRALRVYRARHCHALFGLSSEPAILVNIAISRTFVRLRHILAIHEELARQMKELRWRQSEQGQKIEAVFDTIQQLVEAPAEQPKRRIGFPISKAGPALKE